MPVHLNPRSQPISSTVNVNHPLPVASIQKRLPFGDSLEIRKEGTGSWLDCFKNCFKAIWDFILRIFSKAPTKKEEEVPNNPQPIVERNLNLEKFMENDFYYDDLSKQDRDHAVFAQGMCSFPKLALCLRNSLAIDLQEACKRINEVHNKFPFIHILSTQFVMEQYGTQLPDTPKANPLPALREVPTPLVPNARLDDKWRKYDLDYGDLDVFDGKTCCELEHDCSFPKLALHLHHVFGLEYMEAVKRINAVNNKYPDKIILTARFVMQNY